MQLVFGLVARGCTLVHEENVGFDASVNQQILEKHTLQAVENKN